MSTVTKPIILDETGRLIVDGLARQNFLLSQIVSAQAQATPVATLNEIHEIVRLGEAPNVFSYGDQIMLNYNDGQNNYVLPWDVVAFGDYELEDGETRPGMVIQSHYCMQIITFSPSQAIKAFPEGLPAGTYHFTIGTTWGDNCIAGTVYQFTLTSPIPANGQIVIGKNGDFYTWGAPEQEPTNWRVFTFSSANSTTPIETVTLTEGSDGTDLGTLSSSAKFGNGGLTNLQAAAYGYNRWGHSSARQYYNSAASAGNWWAPQHDTDRPPQELPTIPGFMAGFDEAFLNIIKPVKVTTALNTASDSEIGTSEITYDTFFASALEQEYIVPQVSGVEGAYWPYWKARLGLTSPQLQGASGVNTRHIRYGYAAKTTPASCRLRSASITTANVIWYVSNTGNVSTYYGSGNASIPYPSCPACVII